MKTIGISAALSFIALLCACSKTIEVTAEDAQAMIQVDFDGDCVGQGETANEFGTVTFVKDDSSGDCVIDLTWNGPIADMGPASDALEQDANVEDARLERVEVFFEVVRVENSAERPVNLTDLTEITSSVSISDTPLYDVTGPSLNELLPDDGITVTFEGEEHPVVAAAERALDRRGPLQAAATVRLTLSSVDSLQRGNPHALLFRHDFRLTAGASVLD